MGHSEIYIKDSLAEAGQLLSRHGRVIAVVDRNVDTRFQDSMTLKEKIVIDAYESRKTLETVSYIAERLIEMRADRNTLLLGIGGGITTDITGFTASIFKRGIRCAFFPTTLLAQVDASVGGKNGVNVNGLKNMLGTINQPAFIYTSTTFLHTLPEREITDGLAEMLKTFIIADAETYREAVEIFSDEHKKAIREHPVELLKLIRRAVDIKSQIVDSDTFEIGDRRKLNFGHTFAHAMEFCAAEDGRDLHHGEAVAAGMIVAAEISAKLGFTMQSTVRKLREDFLKIRLPIESEYPFERLLTAIKNDKKCENESIHFVFMEDIGRVNVSLTPFDRLQL